jgi:hypothetical protein
VNVEVRIGTLVLDGVELRQSERAALPLAVQDALAQLLTPAGAGNTGQPQSNPAIDVNARTPRVETIAGQIATAVNGSLPATTVRSTRRRGRR